MNERANDYGTTVDEKLAAVRDAIWSLVYLQDLHDVLRDGAVDYHICLLRRYERFLAHVQYQRDHQLALPGFTAQEQAS